jgi:hypothetical protein
MQEKYVIKDKQFKISSDKIKEVLKNSTLTEDEKYIIEYNFGYVIGMYQGERDVVKNILNFSEEEIDKDKKLEILTKIFE